MICPKCGTNISEEMSFCPACGSAVRREMPEQTPDPVQTIRTDNNGFQPQNPVAPVKNESNNGSLLKKVAVLLCIILGVVVIAGCVLLLLKHQNNGKTEPAPEQTVTQAPESAAAEAAVPVSNELESGKYIGYDERIALMGVLSMQLYTGGSECLLTGTVKGSGGQYTSVYRDADLNSETVGTVPAGMGVNIFSGTNAGWYYINYGELKGYVSACNVNIKKTTGTVSSSNSEKVYVYTGPSENTEHLSEGPLGNGYPLFWYGILNKKMASSHANWYCVEYLGKIGYVCAENFKPD